MTREETDAIERAIAAVVKHIRATEIEPLRARIDRLERDLGLERRLADIERRLASRRKPEPAAASIDDADTGGGNVARLRSGR